MKCIICKKNFKDGWEHIFKMESWPYQFKDKAHADYFKEIEKSNYTKPCFCGGKIINTAWGENSWEIYCSECGFLYDED